MVGPTPEMPVQRAIPLWLPSLMGQSRHAARSRQNPDFPENETAQLFMGPLAFKK
jgi:hypothetical protein